MSSDFSSPLLKALDDAVQRGRELGMEVNKREWEWLLEAATGTQRIQWILGTHEVLPTTWHADFQDLVQRRLLGEPVQYIIGLGAFYGRDFEVGPGVLIPRPETELLVEWAVSALKNRPNPKIIDLGTGSGCIAITLALELAQSQVSALDISTGALEVAGRNASRLGARVAFSKRDLLLEDVPAGPYDLVISNPPYVPLSEKATLQSEVVGYEPHVALFAGSDPLLFYRRIAAISRGMLSPSGLVCVEIHSDFGPDVCHLFENQHFSKVAVQKDLAGLDRFVTASVGVG